MRAIKIIFRRELLAYFRAPFSWVLASLFLLGNYFVSQPLASAVDIGILLAGIPVFVLWRRAHAPTTES